MKWNTNHINELSDGQAKPDDDHIGGAGHRPGPLIVGSEKVLEKPLFRLGVRPALDRSCNPRESVKGR